MHERQEILTYASQHTVREAAKKFNISEQAIYGWRKRGTTKQPKQAISWEFTDSELVIRVPKKDVKRALFGGVRLEDLI